MEWSAEAAASILICVPNGVEVSSTDGVNARRFEHMSLGPMLNSVTCIIEVGLLEPRYFIGSIGDDDTARNGA